MYLPNFKLQLNTINSNSFFSFNYFAQNSEYTWFHIINKNDVNFSNSQLIDISGYSKNFLTVVFYNQLNLLSLTNCNYFFKTRQISSCEKNFQNLFFLERELQEMLGVRILNLKDTRNLLLDYTYYINPLDLNYPVEGYQEIFLNIFEDKIEYNTLTYVEL